MVEFGHQKFRSEYKAFLQEAMKVQKTKTNNIGNTENIKPYVVVGIGVLVIAVSVFQLLSGAPGNILQSRADSSASEEATNPGTTKQDEQSLIVENIDSDSDGLTDTEEEQIYRTDALKPDSDGDGFKDGDEVKTGHDPLVNESGTTTSSSSATDQTSQEYNRFIASNPDDLTNLDPLEYLSNEDIQDISGGDPSEQTIEKLSTLALTNATTSANATLPTIPDSSIVITNASGKQAAQQYLLSIGSVMLQLAPFSDQEQLVNYFLASLKGDTTKTQTLVNIAKTSEAQLKTIPVPKEMVDIHKKMIGVMQVFQQSANTLLNFNTVDPNAGIVATNQIRIVANATDELARNMIEVLNKYDIKLAF